MPLPADFAVTTPTPEATPAPIASAPASVFAASHDDVEPTPEGWLRAAGWPDDLIPWALATMRCESNFHPDSVNPGGPFYGLFQEMAFWADVFGYTVDELLDPVINARVALGIYQRDGASPWPNCGH